MIKFEGVSKAFADKKVVNDVTLDFPEKGICAIVGPSGVGKTTLLRLLLGLEKPDKGSVVTDIQRFSVVFEDDVLLPWLSAEKNITLANGVDEEKAKKALDAVGLGGEYASLPTSFSGGMKRRLAIARALAYDGDCLILDEPTIRLNEELAFKLMEHIKEDWKKRLVIMVTHDVTVAQKYADHIFEIRNC